MVKKAENMLVAAKDATTNVVSTALYSKTDIKMMAGSAVGIAATVLIGLIVFHAAVKLVVDVAFIAAETAIAILLIKKVQEWAAEQAEGKSMPPARRLF